MVTVSVTNIQFLLPIKSGTIIEIKGNVVKTRNVKLEIQVEIFVEDMYFNEKHKAVNALFTFAAINNDNKPIPIL